MQRDRTPRIVQPSSASQGTRTTLRDPWIIKPWFVYDGHETLRVSEDQVDALEYLGMIAYSPEDGPNGLFYRPCDNVTVEQIKEILDV